MSGGHGHDGGSAHGAGHLPSGHGSSGHGSSGEGHDTGHGDGHDAQGAHGAHGPAEIPAAPAERCISPARSDFEQPWPGKGLLWPLVWTGVAGVLGLLAVTWTGPILHGDHGGTGEHGGGATPAHGEAAPGTHAEPAGMAGHGG